MSATDSGDATPAAARPSLGARTLDRLLAVLDNPILLRELRAAFRRKRFVILHTTLLALVALALLMAMFLMADTAQLDPSEIGQKTFLIFAAIEAGLIILVFPAFSCTSITEERVTKSFDLLVTTRLTPWQIVLGKTLASFIYGLLFIIATAPLVAITFLYGGVTPEQIVLTYVVLCVSAAMLTAYSIYVSSVCSSTLKAVVSSYLGAFILGPILFGPIQHVTLVHVVGPLTKDITLIRTREWIRGLDGVNSFLYWGGLAAYHALIVSFFFLIATNRLKPSSANKSTALRLWFVAFLACAIGGTTTLLLHNLPEGPRPPAQGQGLHYILLIALGSILVVFILAAIAFAGEPVTLAPRLEAATARQRGLLAPLRILMPGAKSGAAFVTILLVLAELVAALVFLFPLADEIAAPAGDHLRDMPTILTWGTAWTIAFVVFVAQLAIALSAWIAHPIYARLWTTFTLVGITFYPVFCFYLNASTSKARLHQGYYLSPVTVALSVVYEPRSLIVGRQLVLFGPSGDEIRQEVTKLAEEMHDRPDIQALPIPQQNQAIAQAKAERTRQIVKVGVPAHVVSLYVYLALGIALAVWNRIQLRKLALAASKKPAPATAPSEPAPTPAPAPPAEATATASDGNVSTLK